MCTFGYNSAKRKTTQRTALFFVLVSSRMESILNYHNSTLVFVLSNPYYTEFLFYY
jgi:hypothetical protein